MAEKTYKPVGFFRAFFHLMAGMFLGIFVPLTSILNEFDTRSAGAIGPEAFWAIYYLVMTGTGVALLATAFGANRWKVYLRRTAYVTFTLLLVFAARIR